MMSVIKQLNGYSTNQFQMANLGLPGKSDETSVCVSEWPVDMSARYQFDLMLKQELISSLVKRAREIY